MAIKRRQNWLGQQRVDVPHLKSVESAVSNDFDELLNGLVIGEGNSYVVRGLKINMPGSIGASANGLQLIVENSAFLHGASNESGTFYTIPVGTPTEVLSSTTNPRVQGAFTPNTDNYVGIEFVRSVDDDTSDQVYFWNPTTNVELSRTVPLALILDYNIIISTSAFGSNVLPIAVVQTDSANNVVEISDRRPLLHRLGSAGDNEPNPFYEYNWPETRVENFYSSTSSTLDPFSGGDKSIGSLKEWKDAVMTEIKKLKGTSYWYSESPGSITKLRQDLANSLFTGKGGIVHGAVDFQGQVAGMSTDVIIKTSELSAPGPITLVADGIKDIDELISDWNIANPDTQIILYSGDGSQIPTVDIVMTSKIGQVNWNSNIFINFIGGRLRYQISSNEETDDITLTDNQVAYIQLVRGINIIPNLIFTNGGTIVDSVGDVNWTTDLQPGDFIKDASRGDEFYYEIDTVVNSSRVILTTPFQEIDSGPSGFDAQYAFGVYETNPVPSTERHIQIADRASVPFGEDFFWLFFRQDDTGSTPKVYARPLGGSGELEQGESVDINDNTSLNILDYIGSTSESDTDPEYDELAPNAKTGTTNYNTINGENLTDRMAKITSMVADKAQDKTIQFNGSWTICENTTNGTDQDIQFFKEGGAPTLKIIMNSSNNDGVINMGNTLSLATNQVAYFSVDRNAAFNLADLTELTVTTADLVPLDENVFIFATRGTGNEVYLWDGTEIGEGPNFSPSAVSDILDSNSYDEHLEVISGVPADDNQVTGPILPNTILTLPNDSRDSNNPQGYVNGRGVLEIELNGQLLKNGVDWQEVGAPESVQTTFEILIDLEVDDVLTCRIDTTGGYVGVGGGIGGGEANDIINIGGEVEIYKQKVGADLELRTLLAGTNISLTQNADTITIGSVPGAGLKNVVNKSINSVLALNEDVILVDATAGVVTIELPPAATANGKKYDIKKVDGSANSVTIDANGSETIDGNLTLNIGVQYQSWSLICNGTAWFII